MSAAKVNEELERLRQMAEKLECFIEEDFLQLADVTPGTGEAWRKRGQGPASIRLGKTYLYPIKELKEFLSNRTKTRSHLPVKGAL